MAPTQQPTRDDFVNLLPRLENAIEFMLYEGGTAKPLRWRLAEAYRDQLSPLQAEDFCTQELIDLFNEIDAAMTAYEMPTIGRIDAAGHLMPGGRARSVVKMIFRLYTGVVHEALRLPG